MEYQDYWKVFEQSGSIKDYLHYAACARDELAAGIAEEEKPESSEARGITGIDGLVSAAEGTSQNAFRNMDKEEENIPERTTMRAALTGSALGSGVPLPPEYALLSGTPAAMGQPSSIGLVLLSGLREDSSRQEKKDPNP